MSFKRNKPPVKEEESPEYLRNLGMGGTSLITGVMASNREGRADIYVDKHKAGVLTIDQVVELGLVKNMVWSDTVAEKVIGAAQETLVLDKAIRLLNFNARSSKALQDKLIREEKFDPNIVEKIIERLISSGMLDDEAYAEQIARSGLMGKGFGARRVESEMHKRRVPKELINEAIAKVRAEEETDEVEVALAQAEKGWNRLNNLETRAKKARIYSWLARRGFGPDVINQVLAKLGQEIEEETLDEWPEEDGS